MTTILHEQFKDSYTCDVGESRLLKNGAFAFLMLCLTACSESSIGEWPAFVPNDQLVSRPKLDYPRGIDAAVVRGDDVWVHHEGDFFRSSDEGRTWSVLVLPQRIQAIGLQVSEDKNTIVLISRLGNLLRSDNAGETWETTDLKPILMQTKSSFNEEDYDFYFDEVIISDDFNNFSAVAACDIFISNDGAKSWRSVAGERTYAKPSRDYCVSGVISNQQFVPQFSLAYMTGSIASGEYVMRFDDGNWSELCSFDIPGLLLKSVADCREIEELGELSYFYQKDQSYPDAVDEGYDEAVFNDHHFPIVDMDVIRANKLGFSDGSGRRNWIVNYYGVALSLDKGSTWETLRGGIVDIDDRAVLNDGTLIARHRDKLYFSDDGSVWQLAKDYESVAVLLDVPKGALLSHEGLTLIENKQSSSNKNISFYPYQLLAQGNVVWATGSDSIAVSVDKGDNWLEVEGLDIDSDSSHWHCHEVCIKMDYQGGVWVASIIDQALDVSLLSSISSQDIYASYLWASFDLKRLVVIGYIGESEEPDYWFSSDGGKNWKQVALNGEMINNVIFASPNKVIMSSTSSVYIFDSDIDDIARVRMPGYIYDDSLCQVNDKIIAFDLEGDHPEVPGDDDYFTIYSQDLGQTWFATQSNFGWCDVHQ